MFSLKTSVVAKKSCEYLFYLDHTQRKTKILWIKNINADVYKTF